MSPPAARRPVLRVRGVAAEEVDAWCACPLSPGEEGYEAWLAAERAWVGSHHPGPRDLFVAEDAQGHFVGKADVPIDRRGRWTLWAPTVRTGPLAARAMRALAEHLLSEARRRGARAMEVLLEEGHAAPALAERVLRESGFSAPEERLLFRRDLGPDLPGLPSGIRSRSLPPGPAGGDDRAAIASLLARAGASDSVLEEAREGTGPRGVVLEREGRDVGIALAGSGAGEGLLTEEHLGLVPEARGQGLGVSLLLAFLAWGSEDGARTYVGSTATWNGPMRRTFARAGCAEIGRRLVFRARP